MTRRSSTSREIKRYLPAKIDLIYYCIFMIPISTYYCSQNTLSFCIRRPGHWKTIIIQMTITFDSDKDGMVYTLEKIISHARDNQSIFFTQTILWISLIISLQQGLIICMDNIKARANIMTHEVSSIPQDIRSAVSSSSTSEDRQSERHQEILAECEEYLWELSGLCNFDNFKASGKTRTARINP